MGGEIQACDRAFPGGALVAVVLSAFENAANRDWWRRPTTDGVAYLNQLAAWGHRLTDVEKIAAGIQPEPTEQDAEADAAAE